MYIIIILAFVFLFWGEPDVWDKTHSFVMNKLEVTNCDNIKK